MSVFDTLSAAERAELDEAVRAAFVGGASVAEATEHFLSFLAGATQAHRPYPDMLRAEWELAGSQDFVKRRWKAIGGVVDVPRRNGAVASLDVTRGAKRREDDGRERWMQLPLNLWTLLDLELKVGEARKRVEAAEREIAVYEALIGLLRRTGCEVVQDALDAERLTLDDFIGREVAS